MTKQMKLLDAYLLEAVRKKSNYIQLQKDYILLKEKLESYITKISNK